MSNQRLISDARRRARLLSRRDGRPYQIHLDEIAQAAGREDWNVFIKNPVEIAIEPLPSIEPEVKWEIDRLVMMRRSSQVAILGMGIVVASMLAMPYFLPDGFAQMVIMGMMTAGSTVIIWSALLALSTGIFLLIRWKPISNHIGRRRLGLMATEVVSRLLLPFGFLALFLASTPMVGAPHSDDVMAVREDGEKARYVTFEEKDRDMQVAWISPKGAAHGMSIVQWDNRLTPPSLRRIPDSDDRKKEFMKKFRDHPVMRISGVIDCSSRKFRPTALELADSAYSPTVVSQPINGKRKGELYTLSTSDAARLCAQTPGGQK